MDILFIIKIFNAGQLRVSLIIIKMENTNIPHMASEIRICYVFCCIYIMQVFIYTCIIYTDFYCYKNIIANWNWIVSGEKKIYLILS